MEHKGLFLRPRCIGTVRTQTQLLINQSIKTVKKGKHQTSYSTAAAIHTETFAGPDPFENHTGITLNIKHDCTAAFCAGYLKGASTNIENLLGHGELHSSINRKNYTDIRQSLSRNSEYFV